MDGYLQQQPPSFGYALGALSLTEGLHEARLRMYPRYILSDQAPFEFRPEPSTEPGSQSLPEQRIRVRPWTKNGVRQQKVGQGGSHTVGSKPRPIPVQEADEILERLTLPSPDGRCGIYLRAPSRFGKTHLIQWLMTAIQAQATEELRIPIQIDLVSWSTEKNWELVLSGILEYISEATGLNDISAATFELSLRKTLHLLRTTSKKKVVLILMFESLDALNPVIRGYFEAHLRAAFDRSGYRATQDGGLRVLLASRFPRASTLLNRAGGSSLLPFLHEIQLSPLSREAAIEWARQQEHWADSHELLLWLYQETQGHPEFFTRLVRELPPRDGVHGVARLRELQDDATRARLLFSNDTSARNLITQVAELVKQTAEEFWQALPPNYQARIVNPQNQVVDHTPRRLTPEEARLASGLFLRDGKGNIGMIPFVQRMLEITPLESGETPS
jgi:hypothetical protein